MKGASPAVSNGVSALLGGAASVAASRRSGADSTPFHLDLDFDTPSRPTHATSNADASPLVAAPGAASDSGVDRVSQQAAAARMQNWRRDQAASRAAKSPPGPTDTASTDGAGESCADRIAEPGSERAEQTRTRESGRSTATHAKGPHRRVDTQAEADAVDAVVDEVDATASGSAETQTASEPEASEPVESDAATAAGSASPAGSTVAMNAAQVTKQVDGTAGADDAATLRLDHRGDAAQQAVWQRLQALLGGDAQQAVAAALDDGSLRMEFTMALAQSDVPVDAGQALKSVAATTLPAAQIVPTLAANSPALEQGALTTVMSSIAGNDGTAEQVLASVASLLVKHESGEAASTSGTGEALALAALGGSAASEVARQMAAATTLASSPMPSATPTDPAGRLMLMQDNWATDLVDRVQVQARELRQEARIELHPQELGAMMIRIHFSDGVPQVQFAADSAQARAALQAALPQLQQMFASAGLAAPQVQVGERLGERLGARAGRLTDDPVTASESATDAPRRRARGRDARALDSYA